MTTSRLLIFVGLLSGCFARRTYPDAGPDITFTVRELSAPVEIDIDAFGVPHISAQNDADALAGVGFMHARDRGYQLEMLRRVSQGRLAEIFGADVLDVDRRMRLLSWQYDAQIADLPEHEKALLLAYCAGINRGYAETPQPLELKLLKLEPAPWTPHDVLLIARLQSWLNATDASKEVLRARLQQTVEGEVFDWMTMPSPVRGAAITAPDPGAWPDVSALPAPPAGEALISAPVSARDDKQVQLSHPEPTDLLARTIEMVRALEGMGGSNAFAVSGQRTADGKPILAGDPHLSLSWPPVWYELHVSTPEWEASGGSLPGMPIVVIGRAKDIAWSLTVSYADSQNLVALEVDGTRYKAGRRWQEMTPWPQTFSVKDSEPVEETYYAVDAGPLYGPGREGDLPAGATYALQWPLLRPDPISYVSDFIELYKVSDGPSALEKIRALDFGALNWTFATSNGDIGFTRGGAMAGPGPQPLPIPLSAVRAGELPPLEVLNPPEGYIVTTNQAIHPTERRSTFTSGTWRAMRAMSVLASREDWTPDDLRGLQLDTVNLEAAQLVPGMLKVVGRPTGLEAEMVSALSRWDYQMSAGEPGPLIYEAWRGALHRRLFASHIRDTELREDFLRSGLSEAPMVEAMLSDDARVWWDDPRTPPEETREQAIRAGLAEAARELSDGFGGNLDKWRWDAALVWTPTHPFASKRFLRSVFGQDPLPLSGGLHTINCMVHQSVVSNYAVTSGPSLRQVVVPGGPAGFVLPGGNAGQPGHPFNDNQLPDWVRNRQHVAGVASGAGGGLRLEP